MDKNLRNYNALNDIDITPFLNVINSRYHNNQIAFRKHIPNLLPVIRKNRQHIEIIPAASSFSAPSHSKVINDQINDEANLVDVRRFETVYGLRGRFTVLQQVEKFFEYLPSSKVKALSESHQGGGDVCVIFGLGAGWHLPSIVASGKFKHILVYESDEDMLNASCHLLNWEALFDSAITHKTQLYLQIGVSGASFNNDITELCSMFVCRDIYIFKHFNTSIFNQLHQLLLLESHDKHTLCEQLAKINLQNTPPLLPSGMPLFSFYKESQVTGLLPTYPLYKKNLAILRQYLPEIASQMENFECNNWHPCIVDGVSNLYNKEHDTVWLDYGHQDAVGLNTKHFKQKPSQDELIIGYSGLKHFHYYHHEMIRKLDEIKNDVGAQELGLPDNVECLVLYGLELGFCLEKVYGEHNIKHLVICESSLDTFYGSLYAIDWQVILEKCDKKGFDIYINLGDDGNNLINDLTKQFQKIGSHTLAQTFFYKPYYNPVLDKFFLELREHLKTLLMLGEHCDYVLYGMSHTQWAIDQDYPILIKPDNEIKHPLPVFVVGNGPSLDESIAAIKEHQNNVLVISCGTALTALLKHGIKPDFHAEIEQNMASYSWIARNAHPDDLKGIALISCNGIHPDTAKLFEKVYFMQKHGESSSHYFFNDLPNIVGLKTSYPTVTNYVMDFVLAAGFQRVYLFGVDLGFLSPELQHAKSSAYYDANGTAFLDKSEHTILTVKGNFTPVVKTKYEFKLATKTMGECILQYGNNIEVYNTSNGAYIPGTFPLKCDNIMVDGIDKQKLLMEFITSQFSKPSVLGIKSTINLSQSAAGLETLHLCTKAINEIDDMNDFVHMVRKRQLSLFNKKHDIAFYLLNGTINSFLAYLLKIPQILSNPENFEKVLTCWNTLIDVLVRTCRDSNGLPFDNTVVFPTATVLQHIKQNLFEKQLIQIVSVNTKIYEFTTGCIENFGLSDSFFILVNLEDTTSIIDDLPTIVICDIYQKLPQAVQGRLEQLDANVLIVSNDNISSDICTHPLSFLLNPQLDIDKAQDHCLEIMLLRALSLIINDKLADLYINKYRLYADDKTPVVFDSFSKLNTFYRYDAYWFYIFNRKNIDREQLFMNCGFRMHKKHNDISMLDLKTPCSTENKRSPKARKRSIMLKDLVV